MEWGLTMTQGETEAVIEMLNTCEEPVEVKANRAEGIVGTDTSGQVAAGEATATPTYSKLKILAPLDELRPGELKLTQKTTQLVVAGVDPLQLRATSPNSTRSRIFILRFRLTL